jgi:hypothetical protein
MDNDNTQPTPEPAQPETAPPGNPISEPNPIPVSPDEPTEQAPIPPIESVSTEVSPEDPQAPPSSEDPSVVKDQNPAPPSQNASARQGNGPLTPASDPFPVKDEVSSSHGVSELAPTPEIPSEPNKPNITVEKRGKDVTITEVMKPEPEEKTETAQMAGNEPLPATAPSVNEAKDKQRKENLKLANEKRQNKKREKITEILNLFSEKSEITNDEVEKLLHVSDATATRYLETLEKEGKIKQVGKTGKGVSYEKI